MDLPNMFPPPDVEEAFPVAKQAIFVRLSEVTLEEVITKSIITFWHFLMAFSYLTALNSLFSVVTVGLGALPVQAWPPLFGSPKDAYTIRQFWG